MEETNRFIEQLKLTKSSTAATFLVEQYQKKVYSFCLRMVRNQEAAEELAQDAFLKAFKNIKSLKENNKFEAWLMRLTYHIVIDYIRRRKMNYSPIEQAGSMVADDNPHLDLVNKDRKDRISAIFGTFESGDQLILTLYYLQDKSIRQIEAITGLTQSNIKVKLYRTREMLREKLQQISEFL